MSTEYNRGKLTRKFGFLHYSKRRGDPDSVINLSRTNTNLAGSHYVLGGLILFVCVCGGMEEWLLGWGGVWEGD